MSTKEIEPKPKPKPKSPRKAKSAEKPNVDVQPFSFQAAAPIVVNQSPEELLSQNAPVHEKAKKLASHRVLFREACKSYIHISVTQDLNRTLAPVAPIARKSSKGSSSNSTSGKDSDSGIALNSLLGDSSVQVGGNSPIKQVNESPRVVPDPAPVKISSTFFSHDRAIPQLVFVFHYASKGTYISEYSVHLILSRAPHCQRAYSA